MAGMGDLLYDVRNFGGCWQPPATAFACEYSISRVRIYATLQADGTLDVTEDRTYDINGEYHGVCWDLSRDGGEGSGLAIMARSRAQSQPGATACGQRCLRSPRASMPNFV
jgi:hypothetical protein